MDSTSAHLRPAGADEFGRSVNLPWSDDPACRGNLLESWARAMAWFLNLYRCKRCERRWAGESCCRCSEDCPYCGALAMSPQQSEEVTTVIETDRDEYVVLWSPETAKDEPDYRELGRFRSRAQAIEFLSVDS